MNTVPSLMMLGVVLLGVAIVLLSARVLDRRNVRNWLWSYVRGSWRVSSAGEGPQHVLFCFVDHFEPRWRQATYEDEVRRVDRWMRDYPRLCSEHRDADGFAPRHTFFYPEEEYRPEHLDKLAALCRAGFGEIEVHLHHDGDTDAGLREKLRRFTRLLVERHDALPVDAATGTPMWSFIHGNWALDNSRPDGRWCGVDNELTVLREEGCYADFTFPSAPDVTQPSTINSIYYAADDSKRPKSHDRGVPVRVGGRASGDLMIIQGPLGFNWSSRKFGVLPRIENGDVRTSPRPTAERVDAWIRLGARVRGRPDWIFVKVHTHGTQERDMDTLLGPQMAAMFSHLESRYNDGRRYVLHYVSAREMYNIAKAAEAGASGDPGTYRDFIVPRPLYRGRASCVRGTEAVAP